MEEDEHGFKLAPTKMTTIVFGEWEPIRVGRQVKPLHVATTR